MLAILSPAKRMRTLTAQDGPPLTRPLFEREAEELAGELKQYPPWQLESLLKVNPQLAMEAFDAFWRFSPDAPRTAALFSYQGLQYQHLAPETFSQRELLSAQERLRILSGLYGLLRPLDGIQPYRLEMGCRRVPPAGSLYRFWGSRLHDALFSQGEVVLNLASNEYSRAVTPFLQQEDRLVTVEFLLNRRGKLVTPATYAKMARGIMARKIVTEGLSQPEQLRDFQWEGFRYAPGISTPDRLCFVSA